MKVFEIEGKLTACMKADVVEATEEWYPDSWGGVFLGKEKTIIVKSKDSRCIYEDFETDFERNEAWYKISSITGMGKEDDDNGDWWKGQK